jgi:hypothetical protein
MFRFAVQKSHIGGPHECHIQHFFIQNFQIQWLPPASSKIREWQISRNLDQTYKMLLGYDGGKLQTQCSARAHLNLCAHELERKVRFCCGFAK